ncbi:WXG100 family type VII secretion target [Peribacillus frigoritolerans]|uniref:WXG100 family type VII secretion target n=1 Tax=Peribacillus frigoritolerans TaxID=450367 RepID=UPI003F865430
MSKVNSSPEALRKHAQQINKYISQQQQLLQTLKAAHRSIGSQWRDKQHDKFGKDLDDMIKQIKKTIPGFESYIKHLKAKADQLDSYLK